MRRAVPLIALALLLNVAGCDSQQATEEFAAAASAEPAGFTKTDALGQMLSEDVDDWRTAPLFLGKVRVDPAYPNPVVAGIVTIPLSVLEFDAVRGGLVLRAHDNSGRLAILDEVNDAASPGAYVFQFPAALLARTGLARLFVLDRFGELISYGDLELQ